MLRRRRSALRSWRASLQCCVHAAPALLVHPSARQRRPVQCSAPRRCDRGIRRDRGSGVVCRRLLHRRQDGAKSHYLMSLRDCPRPVLQGHAGRFTNCARWARLTPCVRRETAEDPRTDLLPCSWRANRGGGPFRWGLPNSPDHVAPARDGLRLTAVARLAFVAACPTAARRSTPCRRARTRRSARSSS
jgi:hypothetical protein